MEMKKGDIRLDDNLNFPFPAVCIVARETSPVQKGDKVEEIIRPAGIGHTLVITARLRYCCRHGLPRSSNDYGNRQHRERGTGP